MGICNMQTERPVKGSRRRGTEMNMARKETIDKWANEKSAEQLATMLWAARKNIESAVRDCKYNRRYILDREVERLNKDLASALIDNGIKPTKVIVQYYDCCAKECLYWEDDDGECKDCEESSEVTEQISLWVWEINDGVIEGITASLKSVNYACEKIILADTGIVLYEESGE